MSEFPEYLFHLNEELPRVATGIFVRASEIENMQTAASIVNDQVGRALFEVEIIPPDENVTENDENYVQIRLVGEWLKGGIRDASRFWSVKRDLDASSPQSE